MIRTLSTISAVLILAASAGAVPPQVDVIYSRAAGGPTTSVPGAVDNTGAAAATTFATIVEFWLSPDGTKWLLKGTTAQGSTADNILLLGGGLTGSMILQDGRPFPGASGAELVDFLSSSMSYPFNANNQWAVALRARGGASSTFNKIIRYDAAGTGTLRFQMGDLYTGMTDTGTASNPSGDETIGNTTAGIHLLNDGRIGWHDLNPGSLSSTRYPVTAYDKVKQLQNRLDSVTPISGAGSILITGISSFSTFNTFWASPDGSRVSVRGKVDEDGNGISLSPTDPDAVWVDGQVRAQVAKPLPGDATITPTDINNIFVAANGDWFIRGIVGTSASWVVRNGAVLAKTGAAIGSTGETWAPPTSIFSMAGNSNGDWVVIGKTNNPDPAVDDVLVINNEIVLREGDPVSIDLDGTPPLETAYIGRGVNTNAAFSGNNCIGIAPDKTVYVLANLRTTASGGADLAATGVPVALIRISPPATTTQQCCRGTTCVSIASGTCTGTVGNSASLTVGTCGPNNQIAHCCYADYDHSGTSTIDDLFIYINTWLVASPYTKIDGNTTAAPSIDDLFIFINLWLLGCQP